jgi:hypothetical protein
MLICNGPASTSSGRRATESKINAIIIPKTSNEANMEGVRPVSAAELDVGAVID